MSAIENVSRRGFLKGLATTGALGLGRILRTQNIAPP